MTIPMQPNGQRYDYLSLCVASDDQLETAMRQGVQPRLADLAGWEFRGYNTLVLTEMLGFRKFKKGFYQANPSEQDPAYLNGYNVQVVQTPLADPWFDRVKGGQSIKHAWYRCHPVRMTETDCRYPNGVLVNYDCPEGKRYDPSKRLRDYVVQVYPDNKDLLLGKAFVALAGPLRVFVSYFILERENPSSLQMPRQDIATGG